MERFVKITYIVIVVLFLLAMSILGWYVMDTKKEKDTEVAELRKELNEVTLPKSDKEISTPDDVTIVKEYDYKTTTEASMKITAFDNESKVVWTYKTEPTSMAEYTYDMLWPHYECVYLLEDSKLVVLNTFTGEERAVLNFEQGERVVAAGYYKGDIYALIETWNEEGTSMTHKILKIDNDAHIIASKELPSQIYEGYDQTVEEVEFTRIDESEIEIFVTRLDSKNIEYVTARNF